MPQIIKIDKQSIEQSLTGNTRQYLVGDLKLPQELKHVQDSDLEIGITRYDKSTSELPHTHTKAKEYQYMIAGRTEYLNVETGEVTQYECGDFYLIETGVVYAQRSDPGTVILFIKYPAGNDKVNIEASHAIQEWMKSPLSSEYHG